MRNLCTDFHRVWHIRIQTVVSKGSHLSTLVICFLSFFSLTNTVFQRQELDSFLLCSKKLKSAQNGLKTLNKDLKLWKYSGNIQVQEYQGAAERHSSSWRSSSKNWQVRFHENKEFCMGKKATERVKILPTKLEEELWISVD